jgi:sec-independent protein translocase protein TatC
VTSTIVAYTNKETLLFLIVKSNSVIYYDKQFYFIATNLTDLFSVYLDLSYFIAFQITIVFGLVQLKLFFLPALYSTERKQFILIYRTCILFWVLSIIFLNKIVLPLCWDFFSKFFNHYNYTVTIFLEIKVTEYLSFFITTYYVTVLLGQAFVILFLVINVSKNKLLFIKTTRKLFYLFFLIIATILTPPDVISQLFLSGIFILIFEILIITIILKNLN